MDTVTSPHAPPGEPSRAPDDPVTVLYIGGSGRSGSTLLDRILGSIPQVWSVGELMHLLQVLEGDHRCGCGLPFRTCPVWTEVGRVAFGGWSEVDVARLLRIRRGLDRTVRIPSLLREPDARSPEANEYTDFLVAVYRAVRSVVGAQVVVDATKHGSFAFLLRGLPPLDLRVVHLVRDPRGVAYSWTKQRTRAGLGPWPELPRLSASRSTQRWVLHNVQFHVLASTGVPTLRVRYEDLIAAPREEVGRILRFLGGSVAPTAQELPFVSDGHVDLQPGHGLSGNPMRVRSGRVPLRLDDEWHRALPVRDRRIAAAVGWPLSRRYGYT